MPKENDIKAAVRVAFYIRVSTEDQVERYGIALQKESLLSLIKSRGDKLAFAGEKYVYVDEGVSGTIPLDERPAFSRLVEDLENAPDGNRPFDAVAVFKIDRLARRLTILLDIIEFFEHRDIMFISVNESIDTSTPFGKAILGIVGVIAELELETIKQRTQAGREEAIKQGKAMGAVAPYGFKKNIEGRLERLDEEAKIVELIFRFFLQEGKSSQMIASFLTKEKILSPAASAVYHHKRKQANKKTPASFWRATQIMDILRDEKYTGSHYFNRFGKRGALKPRSEWKLVPISVPQIIDLFSFQKTQKLLESRKHERQAPENDHTYLLSGLLRCAACADEGEDLAHWSGNRKEVDKGIGNFSYAYQCGRKNKAKFTKNCETIPIPAKEIESFILEECLRILNDPKGVYEYQQKLASTRSEIMTLQSRQRRYLGTLNSMPQQREILREQHKAGIIDMDKLKQEFNDLSEREQNLKSELDMIEERLSQKSLSEGYARSLEMFSQQYKGSLQEIRNNSQIAYDLLHALIDSITVFSRPVVEGDKVAGKKKKGQLIPYTLQVKLRLPQEFLNQGIGSREMVGSGQKPQSGGDGRNRTAV